QQITLYPHKDDNNNWIIQRVDGTIPDTLQYVKNGDIVRLLHGPTHKRLHSHDNKPPVTDNENHFEVSGYGFQGFDGDSNDHWRVEIVDYDGKNAEAGKELHTLRSKFKLVHINMGCDLFSHKVKLPKWGFEQQEVTCMRSALPAKATWIIESNQYDKYPANAEKVNYNRPGFFGKFVELNKVMWRTNQGLTDSHPYDSRPSSWVWLRRGISFWGKENRHVYLIGNWFTWYAASASVALYLLVRALLVLRDKRGYRDNFRGFREYYELSGGFFFMAWAYHYLPFFLMGRQLFLHHYLPALYFGILLFCVTFDVACRFIPNRHRVIALILVSSVAIYVFRTRAPLVYGSKWTRNECMSSKLLDTWDYDCTQFPESYSLYETLDRKPPQVSDPMSGRIVEPPSSAVEALAESLTSQANNDANVEKVGAGLKGLTEHIEKQVAAAEQDKKAENEKKDDSDSVPPAVPAGKVVAEEKQPASPHPGSHNQVNNNNQNPGSEPSKDEEDEEDGGEEVDGGYEDDTEPADATEPFDEDEEDRVAMDANAPKA
ncbi:hypothetical protein BGW42_006469, partial [Actinomortierella wolfii]